VQSGCYGIELLDPPLRTIIWTSSDTCDTEVTIYFLCWKIALARNTSLIDDLTAQERQFVEALAKGMSTAQAAVAAGMSHSRGVTLLKSPRVLLAIDRLRQETQKQTAITQVDVVNGFLEAIDLAKSLGEPASMVSGWREIAKVLGLYAPEQRKLAVEVRTQLACAQYEALSDDELVRLIETERDEAGAFSAVPLGASRSPSVPLVAATPGDDYDG
jgi:hypothetical protein